MEGLITALLAIVGIAATIFIGLLKDEVSAWMPKFTKIVLQLACRRCCPTLRDQYGEEWAAHINEYPGKLSQFGQACLCLVAAGRNKSWTRARILAYYGVFGLTSNLTLFPVGMYGMLIDERCNTTGWYAFMVLATVIWLQAFRYFYRDITAYLKTGQ